MRQRLRRMLQTAVGGGGVFNVFRAVLNSVLMKVVVRLGLVDVFSPFFAFGEKHPNLPPHFVGVFNVLR